MQGQPLHKVQVAILYTLRRRPTARFSELMVGSGLKSDAFKFHVHKMEKLEYIEKLSDGQYRLTTIGKEFANNLNKQQRTIQKQPKLSLIIVACQKDADGNDVYLCQKRHRNPYWGFWSFIGGPVRWGVLPEAAAAEELGKQTGLQASFTVRAFYRKRDYLAETEALLEDKLFVILEAHYIQGTLQNSWNGGHNEWLTRDALAAKEKGFAENLEILDMLLGGRIYYSTDSVYHASDY